MEGITYREAARRCLQAMSETQDIPTRFELWKAATFYAKQAREEIGGAGTALTHAGQPLAHPKGGCRARELEAW